MKFAYLALFALTFIFLGCQPETGVHVPVTSAPDSQSTVPYLNLTNAKARLLAARGAQTVATCAMDLRVRPSLVDAVLNGGHDFDWLVSASNYPVADQRTDQAWVNQEIHGIQQSELEIEATLKDQGISTSPWTDGQHLDSLAQFGFYPGFYNLNAFASYQVGPTHLPWYGANGYVYKVFFEFRNPQTDLTPDLYKEFSKRLSDAGFIGDSKIPLTPGWARFLWNNIVVHAPTAESAGIAEKIGLAFFGPSLLSYSRGVDAQNALTGNQVLDWPTFLCTVDPAAIPAPIISYVNLLDQTR